MEKKIYQNIFVNYVSSNYPEEWSAFKNKNNSTSNNLNPEVLPGIQNTFLNSQLNSSNRSNITPAKEKIINNQSIYTSSNSSNNNFKSKEDFIKAILPAAQRIAQKYGIDENIIISQAAFESGYGKKYFN